MYIEAPSSNRWVHFIFVYLYYVYIFPRSTYVYWWTAESYGVLPHHSQHLPGLQYILPERWAPAHNRACRCLDTVPTGLQTCLHRAIDRTHNWQYPQYRVCKCIYRSDLISLPHIIHFLGTRQIPGPSWLLWAMSCVTKHEYKCYPTELYHTKVRQTHVYFIG